MPSVVAVVVRKAPVATFLSSTATFGTAASVESVTVPCKVAAVVCAKAQPHTTAAVSTKNRTRFAFITVFSFRLSAPLIVFGRLESSAKAPAPGPDRRRSSETCPTALLRITQPVLLLMSGIVLWNRAEVKAFRFFEIGLLWGTIGV